MINSVLSTGYYYHIYNRGVEKRNIFLSKRDYFRFLETIDFYRKIPTSMKFSEFKRGKTKMEKLDLQTELIRIFCYSLMPNHFHLLIQQLQEGGVTTFLRKSLDSYAKFFNTKYDRVGPLFQGSFKAKLIEKDEYLLQLSKYIHRNIFTLSMCEGKIYSYSSYNYYLSRETHPFCDKDFILSYFSKTNPNLGYKEFVEEELDDPSLYSLLIDPEE